MTSRPLDPTELATLLLLELESHETGSGRFNVSIKTYFEMDILRVFLALPHGALIRDVLPPRYFEVLEKARIAHGQEKPNWATLCGSEAQKVVRDLVVGTSQQKKIQNAKSSTASAGH
jgi:hypothetical protein